MGAEYANSGKENARYVFLCFDKRFAGIPVLKKNNFFNSDQVNKGQNMSGKKP